MASVLLGQCSLLNAANFHFVFMAKLNNKQSQASFQPGYLQDLLTEQAAIAHNLQLNNRRDHNNRVKVTNRGSSTSSSEQKTEAPQEKNRQSQDLHQ